MRWASGSVFKGPPPPGPDGTWWGPFLNVDLIIDEITAHARGAVEMDSDVDTVFEIGGQDSKYVFIANRYPLDFDMNKVCAAGTGSFLHELANKYGINIVDEFQEIALSSEAPVKLAERCTVFMESDLVYYQSAGREDERLDRRTLLCRGAQLPEPSGGENERSVDGSCSLAGLP